MGGSQVRFTLLRNSIVQCEEKRCNKLTNIYFANY